MSERSSPDNAVPSPVTRLRKGYSNQERDGEHMVDLVDAISGHTVAACIYEPYADEMLAAVRASLQPATPTAGEPVKPTEAMVLAGGDVLLTACESPGGQLHPWKPFDVAQIAIKVYTAMMNARVPATGGDAVAGDAKATAPVHPADAMIGQIEERFPNWRSYRDLVDCIDCTLHAMRGAGAAQPSPRPSCGRAGGNCQCTSVDECPRAFAQANQE